MTLVCHPSTLAVDWLFRSKGQRGGGKDGEGRAW